MLRGDGPREMNLAARARDAQRLHGDARATEIEMHPMVGLEKNVIHHPDEG